MNPPITNAVVVGAPPIQAGVGVAMGSTSCQSGPTLDVTVVRAVATLRVDGSLHEHVATASHRALRRAERNAARLRDG